VSALATVSFAEVNYYQHVAVICPKVALFLPRDAIPLHIEPMNAAEEIVPGDEQVAFCFYVSQQRRAALRRSTADR
jgi:hypothetical protein